MARVWGSCCRFITSSNNHIPRITSLLQRLAQTYGEAVDLGSDGTYHLFPPPHALGTNLEPTLRKLGFGYRAGFLESTLQTLRKRHGSDPGQIEAGLARLRETDVSEVREELLGLKGVGRKVADCVMLMSLDKVSCGVDYADIRRLVYRSIRTYFPLLRDTLPFLDDCGTRA